VAIPETSVPPTRVTLRRASSADAERLQRWRAEPSVRRHQPLAALGISALRDQLATSSVADLATSRGSRFDWIVAVDSEPAGWITLAVHSWEHGVAECGFALTTRQQRRGVMQRALPQLLDLVFHDSRLARIEARCTVDNVPCQRLLERVGFVREGRLRGYFELRGRRVDNFLYALLRSEGVLGSAR
jgi:ribosomal-protein-alanine N-acetyltransferase